MLNFSKYLILKTASIREALVSLNQLSSDTLTLFVVDSNNRIIGSLTDGDIRRKLIEGISLDNEVTKAMNEKFSYVRFGEIDVFEIKKYKQEGIVLLPIINESNQIVRILNLKKKATALPIDAVLMAGGKGERLRPLTDKTPKPLLLVGDKPIIDHNIDRLIDYGVENISVTVNYLGEQLEDHYRQPHNGVQVRCFREPKYLGTMGSVKFVDTFVNDTVLVMNSDLFTNIDYEDFFIHFKNHEADLSVAAVPYSVNIPYGIFELEGRNICGLVEKPTYNYYANAGIYLLKKKYLDLIPDGDFFNATDFINVLINKHLRVIRYPLTGYWIDIGKPVDFNKVQELVKHLT